MGHCVKNINKIMKYKSSGKLPIYFTDRFIINANYYTEQDE